MSEMPRASDGPEYGRRRTFNRSRSLRLSSALKETLRAMIDAPVLAKCRDCACARLSKRKASYSHYRRVLNALDFQWAYVRFRRHHNFSPAQGRPVVTACTCGFRARANYLCAGAPGAAATRPSLRPLTFEEGETQAKLGRNAPREYGLMYVCRHDMRSNHESD